MKVKKRTLTGMERVYSLSKIPSHSLGREPSFLAGSEAHDGSLLLFEPPDYESRTIAEDPGGFISLCNFSRRGRRYAIASTQFRPGFDAAACEIWIWPLDPAPDAGPVKKFPMPYTHRVALTDVGGDLVFLASTLCAKKDFKDDWTHPGGVYAAIVPDPLDADWEFVPCLEGLNKNHGLDLAQIEPNGNSGFLVSAMEGCSFMEIPKRIQDPWPVTAIDTEETSDAFAFDWDGTGTPQIFTIQPFHGNRVHIHRRRGDAWEKSLLTDEIEFGHILWAGELLGRRALVVGWRRGASDLVVYWKKGPGPEDYEMETIDKGIGPAQMIVHRDGDREFLIVSGHGAASVLLYELTKE
jgi:hypothetical protein